MERQYLSGGNLIEEIITLFISEEKYNEQYKLNDTYFRIQGQNGSYTFVFGRMYEHFGYSLSNLIKLADILGTENITDSKYSIDGCETCDYGSDYQTTLRVEGVKEEISKFLDQIIEEYKDANLIEVFC